MCLSRSSKLCCHPCIGYPSMQGCALKQDMPAPGMLRTAKFALQHGIQLVMACLVKRLRDVQHCVWAQGLPANFFLKLKVCRPFHVHVCCFLLLSFGLSAFLFIILICFPFPLLFLSWSLSGRIQGSKSHNSYKDRAPDPQDPYDC